MGKCIYFYFSLFSYIIQRRKWQPTPVFLPRESCGRRSLVGCVHRVAQSRTRLKRLSMHACIGEGNGNPLQYYGLENPRNRGAWWAAVYGVAQSGTRLKRLSNGGGSGCPYRNEPVDTARARVGWHLVKYHFFSP